MSKAEPIIRKIHIAADALWDLRQGTLTRISPKVAFDITSKRAYYERDTDVFGEPGNTLRLETYKGVFERFGDQIVRMSVHTAILQVVIDLCKELTKQVMASPFLDDFGIEVNLHPYEFDEAEMREIMRSLRAALGDELSIELVSIPPEQLTVEHARNNYAAMFMYNYLEWLNMHTKQLEKTHLKEVGLFVPKIYFDPDKKAAIDEATKEELKRRGQDAFEAYSSFLGVMINIQFLPVSFFSAMTPANTPDLRQLIKTA